MVHPDCCSLLYFTETRGYLCIPKTDNILFSSNFILIYKYSTKIDFFSEHNYMKAIFLHFNLCDNVQQ